jgi:peptidoglycan/LPS O-acetylase OafA/YrhL
VSIALAVMAVAAALLPISLALTWYEPVGIAGLLGAPSLTGYQAFSGLAILVVGCGAIGLAGAGVGAWLSLQKRWRGVAVAALIVGVSATAVAIAVARRVLEPPAGSAAQTPHTGAYLGLGAAGALALSAVAVIAIALREPRVRAEVTAHQATPPVVSPPPGNPRFPLMDGLRAVAALLVLSAHVLGNTGAHLDSPVGRLLVVVSQVGVGLFFVLSGFLLYRPFIAAQLHHRRPPRLRDYARRRVLRILPAYWFAITIMAIYPGLAGFWDQDTWRHYLLIQAYWPTSALQGLPQAWSLCVEVAFYALLPLLALGIGAVAARVQRERAAAVTVAVLLGLAAAGFAFRALGLYADLHAVRYSVPSYFFWFAGGMILAVLTVQTPSWLSSTVAALRARPNLCWTAAVVPFGLAYVFGPAGLLGGVNDQLMVFYFLVTVVVVLLAVPAAFDARPGFPRTLLALPVVAWLGLVSYGIYLWHFGVVVALDKWGLDRHDYPLFLAVTFVLTTACAAVSYYVVERPFLALKDRRAPRRAPMVAPATAD